MGPFPLPHAGEDVHHDTLIMPALVAGIFFDRVSKKMPQAEIHPTEFPAALPPTL
jgi:hypothetical protein